MPNASDDCEGQRLPDVTELETAHLAPPAVLRASREQQIAEHQEAIEAIRRQQHRLDLHVHDLESRLEEGPAPEVCERLEQRMAAARQKWRALFTA
jgi:hypothetical protein